MKNNVVKGTRIRIRKYMVEPACLAGVQPKLGARSVDVVGVVRHLRGDHPTHPTAVKVFIDPEVPVDVPTVRPYGCTCPHEHIEAFDTQIVEILEGDG